MTLPQRMRAAAQTLEELSSLYGYRFPAESGWSANELRTEAEHLDTNTAQPNWDNCSGALADMGDGA